MTIPEMLAELFELVGDEEITNDSCDHENPADPLDFCEVCFVTNLYLNCSEDEGEFTEETTDNQRETLETIYEKYCEL
jgi:hypothetical protein